MRLFGSIGRNQFANVLKDAEVAEANNLSEAEQSEASSRRQGDVAAAKAATEIVRAANRLKTIKAQLDAEARSAEETTVQVTREARARAEVELQEIRKSLDNEIT